MAYVGGGERMPPLTTVVHGPSRPMPTGLEWDSPGGQKRPPQSRTPAQRTDQTPGPKPHPETSEMIRLYAEGLTAPQVADTIGCAAKTVRTNLRRAGVELRDDRTGQNLPRP